MAAGSADVFTGGVAILGSAEEAVAVAGLVSGGVLFGGDGLNSCNGTGFRSDGQQFSARLEGATQMPSVPGAGGMRAASVVVFLAFGIAVVGLVGLTVSAFMGSSSWIMWAIGLAMTVLIGWLAFRTRRRVNSVISDAETAND